MPNTSELRVQAGTQTLYATSVTPTVALRGLDSLDLESDNDIEVKGDMTTALAGGDIGIINGLASKGSFKGWATYDHLPYWLDAMLGQATPTGANPYTRQYAAPITTAPAPRIMTLVKGDANVGAYGMTGSLPMSLTLRVEPKKVMEFSGDLVGAVMFPTTLAVLTPAIVTPIMGHQVAANGIKWDTWAGTMGSTTLANCTVRFLELMVKPDRKSRFCFGSLSAQSYIENPWDGTLKLGLEFNGTTKADVDAIIGGTLTQRQIQYTLTTGASQSLAIKFAGTVTEGVKIFEDDDGVVTVNVTLKRTYHPTFANWLKLTSINTISALA